jgi:Putative transposase of IS4/5 family (DUF4096)
MSPHRLPASIAGLCLGYKRSQLLRESNWMCYPRAEGTWKEGGHLVGRGEVTDQAWSSSEPLLPAGGERGGQWREWREHRTVINGILWKVRTGAPWRDLPERYGPWQTCADPLSVATRGTVGSPPHVRADQ